MAKISKTEIRLKELEREIKARGVSLSYEKLAYAGLILKSGLCWFRGRYYLFVDRLKKPRERIDLLQGALEELDRLAAEGRLEAPFGEEAAAGAVQAPDPDPAAAADAGDGEEPSPETNGEAKATHPEAGR